MPSLSSFNDFTSATGKKLASSPDQILNDAAKNTYFFARMVKGRDVADTVQSGQKIIDRIQLTDAGTAAFFHPNEDLDIQNVDVLVSIELDWRFIADHYSYTEQEITLNSGDAQTYYKNLLKSKRQACKTSTWNKKEESLWAAPSNANMEAASGKQPYSIPCFITTDGLEPYGFTTVETLDPGTNSGWRNQIETYDSSAKTDPEVGLFLAFDRMWHKCRFIAPRNQQEYFENDMLQKMVITTNLDGITRLQVLSRDQNDRMSPATNFGYVAGQVTYAGLPIEYTSELDTALVIVSNTVAAAAMPSGQPSYFWLNLMYLYPIFHGTMYQKEKEPMQHPRQPFSSVVWSRSYYNVFCKSRRRQGIITPD